MHVDQELSHSPNFPRNCRQVVGSLVQTPAEHMPESDLSDFTAVNAEDNPTLWPLGKDKKNHDGGSMCSDYTGGETGWSASGTCSSAVNDYKGTLFAGSTAEDFSGDVQEALDGSTAEDFSGDVQEALDCFCHEFADHVPGDVAAKRRKILHVGVEVDRGSANVEVEIDSEVADELSNEAATNASTTEPTATNNILADERINEAVTNASTTELTATSITSADDPMMSANSVETVCEMNPEFFTTDSIACEFIDRVVVETLAFFALPDS